LTLAGHPTYTKTHKTIRTWDISPRVPFIGGHARGAVDTRPKPQTQCLETFTEDGSMQRILDARRRHRRAAAVIGIGLPSPMLSQRTGAQADWPQRPVRNVSSTAPVVGGQHARTESGDTAERTVEAAGGRREPTRSGCRDRHLDRRSRDVRRLQFQAARQHAGAEARNPKRPAR